MAEKVGYRVTVVMFYTFLSSRGCEWLVQDLKTRTGRLAAESPVLTPAAMKETEKVVRAAGLQWHDLRDYFHVCLRALGTSNMPPVVPEFMLGHAIDKNTLNVWGFFDPKTIEWMRKKYVEVEKQFFS
jgi:hypothetical protein